MCLRVIVLAYAAIRKLGCSNEYTSILEFVLKNDAFWRCRVNSTSTPNDNVVHSVRLSMGVASLGPGGARAPPDF